MRRLTSRRSAERAGASELIRYDYERRAQLRGVAFGTR